MARYQVILAYNGSRYQGFQRQANKPTVQSVVEDALRQIGWQGVSILAAGRTDRGVHASGQVIAFDLQWGHTLPVLLAAINAYLPGDVSAREVREVEPDFHPRFDALSRSYRYTLFCDSVRHPLKETYAWRVWPALDVEVLQLAARVITGAHDFAAYGSPMRSGGSTLRTVIQAGWRAEAEMIYFEITANAFLYRMVRRLVYVQVMVGLGRLDLDCIARSLELPGSCNCQGLAPAHGLELVEVRYG